MPQPKKRDVAEAMLSAVPSVFVHLDPRRNQVVVPSSFMRQPHLILEIGLNMPVPIHDLEVDDVGITCTLSFQHRPFWCRLPWEAIFALVSSDQNGVVWPEDVPPGVSFNMGLESKDAGGNKKKNSERPAHLRAVDHEEREDSAPPSTPASEPLIAPVVSPTERKPDEKRKLPPYLKVVK